MRTLTINGRAIVDIPTFYAEINRVFMAGENWALGNSLDALNDLFYGGYGAIKGREPVELVWTDMEASRSALGVSTTRAFLLEKLQRPGTFDVATIRSQLDALEQGGGKTYFEFIFESIADHRNIALVAA